MRVLHRVTGESPGPLVSPVPQQTLRESAQAQQHVWAGVTAWLATVPQGSCAPLPQRSSQALHGPASGSASTVTPNLPQGAGRHKAKQTVQSHLTVTPDIGPPSHPDLTAKCLKEVKWPESVPSQVGGAPGPWSPLLTLPSVYLSPRLPWSPAEGLRPLGALWRAPCEGVNTPMVLRPPLEAHLWGRGWGLGPKEPLS